MILLVKLCWNLLNILKETDLIKLNSLTLDSTSIEANDSSYNVADENQMQAYFKHNFMKL